MGPRRQSDPQGPTRAASVVESPKIALHSRSKTIRTSLRLGGGIFFCLLLPIALSLPAPGQKEKTGLRQLPYKVGLWKPWHEPLPPRTARYDESTSKILPFTGVEARVVLEKLARIADPKLLEQVKKAEQEAGASQASMMRGEAPVKEDPGMERKLQELDNKMQKASEAGDMAEVLRLQKEYQRLSAPASEQSKKTVETMDRPGQLRATARELRVVIAANLMPRSAEIWSAQVKSNGGNKRNPVPPAATIQGYPAGRNPNSLNGGVSYAIYLGPPGIDVVPGAGPYLRKEVKALFVMAEAKTDPEHQAADEALALKLLEKVDYAGLSKLLVP